MGKILSIFVMVNIAMVAVTGAVAAAGDAFTSCGPGYVLANHANVDGIKAAECQKLWCRDLETNRVMGTGDRAASGYVATSGPEMLCDANNNCVECWGRRKWCSGEVAGEWAPERGAYVRAGGEETAYTSYQKGACFAWRLGRPDCPAGQTAIEQGGKWICATNTGTDTASRAASIRRTGAIRRTR